MCLHAGAPLDEGAVCDGRIVCPWHEATFLVSDGALLEPPALEGLVRFAVRVDGEAILVGEKLSPESSRHPPTGTGKMVLVAGAGAAGVASAAALREFGFAGRILLAGAESWLPIDRTALSTFGIAGQMKPDEIPELR